MGSLGLIQPFIKLPTNCPELDIPSATAPQDHQSEQPDIKEDKEAENDMQRSSSATSRLFKELRCRLLTKRSFPIPLDVLALNIAPNTSKSQKLLFLQV
jgi:hypothetical protein